MTLSLENVINYYTGYEGGVEALEQLESCGSSTVVCIETSPYVFQKYMSREVARRICLLYHRVLRYNYKVTLSYFDYEVNLRLTDYLAEFVAYVPPDIIVWRRLLCINSIEDTTIRSRFVEMNYLKILYDICKALYLMQNGGVLHRDCRVDNIGMTQTGTFVLFDFDASIELAKYAADGGVRMRDGNMNDVYQLIESIHFHTNDRLRGKIPPKARPEDYIDNLIQMIGDEVDPAGASRLAKYQIVSKLENMRIKFPE